MEGGIKHGDHGNIAHNGLAGVDAGDIGGVMQRREGNALLDGGHNGVVDLHGACKLLSAMDNAVAHRVDLLHGGHNAVLGAGELVDNSGDSFRMSGHGDVLVEYGLITHQRAVLEMTVDTDALAKTLGHHILSLHINELILERGAACVDNKNFHVIFPFLL